MSLYEISSRYKGFLDFIEENESELDFDSVNDTLLSIEGEFDDKAINVAKFIRNLELDAEAIKYAERDMKERRERIEKKADKLREYLKNEMGAVGKTKISSPWFVIAIKNNPESTVITDQSLLPTKFIVEKVSYTHDKTAIKNAIKDGETIDGAMLVKSTRIDIK